MRVLVTGATGAVGYAIARALEAGHHDVVRSSRTACEDVLVWDLSDANTAPDLPTADLVVHCAANTQWNLSPEAALDANVRTLENLLAKIGSTPLLHLSTLHAVGVTGSVLPSDVTAYRNPYEWSKAAGERLLQDRPDTSILRFPIVFGSRRDGSLHRYSGLFKLVTGIASGLVPAVVGYEQARFDIVSVDDVCRAVCDLIGQDPMPRLLRIGRGAEAAKVDDVMDWALASLNEFRSDRGAEPIARPPILDPTRWERFFLPFAREHFSALQLRTIDVFAEFEPYLSIMTPFEVDRTTDQEQELVDLTVKAWASKNLRPALRTQRAWA